MSSISSSLKVLLVLSALVQLSLASARLNGATRRQLSRLKKPTQT